MNDRRGSEEEEKNRKGMTRPVITTTSKAIFSRPNLPQSDCEHGEKKRGGGGGARWSRIATRKKTKRWKERGGLKGRRKIKFLSNKIIKISELKRKS